MRSFNPGSTYFPSTGRWIISSIETEWSCPVHDQPVTWPDSDDCGDCGQPQEIECLDCLFGDSRVKYDADGWATMSLSWRWLEKGLG